MITGDLPAALRQILRDAENYYKNNLRYPGAPGGTEEERTAGTTISLERKITARDAAIGEMVREVFMKVNKSRLEAKAMPKNQPVPATPATSSTTPQPVKGPPQVVLEQRAKEEATKKHKPPPQKLLEQLQKRPGADTPAKASTEPAAPKTDTTVRLTPRQPKHPPPPKRPSEQAGEAALKKTKQEDVPAPPAARKPSQNKMPILHLQHHTQPHVQFHQHRHVQHHHHHREQVQHHQIFQHLQDHQLTHVPEHQHRHIHQNVLNNQIIHHRDTHVQVLMLIFHHHLLRCDIQEVKDPIQRIEDNHCRDNGKKKYLKHFFQILI